jgi:hypothetical protein
MKAHRPYLKKVTVNILGTQKQNVDFAEIDFTGWTDFIVVRYSATYSNSARNF